MAIQVAGPSDSDSELRKNTFLVIFEYCSISDSELKLK